MTQTVFVTRRIPDVGLNAIMKQFQTIIWEQETPPSKSDIIQNAHGCNGIVTLLSDHIDTEVIESLPKLRVISQYAVGFDNIDISAATRRGIIVANTPGVLTETTADLTWALIMSVCRRIVEADRYVRQGDWKVAWGPKMLLGRDIHNSTLGIVGLGRIGRAVARRATGFSMKILYHSRTRNDETREIERETGAERTNLETLLQESDIVTIHVPLNEDTQDMISSHELAMMKHGAVLVNTSRGSVVDENALYHALKSGHLGGAGLDVFRQEPVSLQNPLLELHNVVVAPHIGSASIAARDKMAQICAENLIAALRGSIPPYIVNSEVIQHE
ncbi:MAG: D-glycerate dehydrogenase [Candidatus Thorarchaeota archaeon]|nr:MAG: D-glycerate dehydrogenase [Candidatus Thorarchaeota archaeon]